MYGDGCSQLKILNFSLRGQSEQKTQIHFHRLAKVSQYRRESLILLWVGRQQAASSKRFTKVLTQAQAA